MLERDYSALYGWAVNKKIHTLILFILTLFLSRVLTAQTTVNLAPCTNCTADSTCLPQVYNHSIAQFDFSGVSTNSGSPTQVTGSAYNFTLDKKSVVQFSYGSTTAQTGGVGAEAGQVTFQLRLDGTAIQGASHDAHGNSTATTASYNYDVDFNEWRTLAAGNYTVDLAAWRHTNLTSGLLGGANLQVAVFPECGFGGGSGSSGSDTLYIAGDSCAAFSVHRNNVDDSYTNNSVIDWTTTDFDELGEFDLTNNRFQPTKPGKYILTASARTLNGGGTLAGGFRVFIQKNGSAIHAGNTTWGNTNVGSYLTSVVSAVVEANGTTDYFDIIYGGSNSATGLSGVRNATYFTGARLDCGGGADGAGTSTTDTLYISGTDCKTVYFSANADAVTESFPTAPVLIDSRNTNGITTQANFDLNTLTGITVPSWATHAIVRARAVSAQSGAPGTSDFARADISHDGTNYNRVALSASFGAGEDRTDDMNDVLVTLRGTSIGYQLDISEQGSANTSASLHLIGFKAGNCGGGSGTSSSTTDTLYIAGDTCMAARAFSAAAQNFTTTSAKIDFTGETYDKGGIFDPATDQYTIAEDGLYAINASINVELDAENEFYRFDLYVNGAIRVVETEICGRNAVSGVVSNLTTTQMLSAGDVVHLEVFVGGGATSVPLAGSASTNYFELYRVDCGGGAGGGTGTPQTLSATDTTLTLSDGGGTVSTFPKFLYSARATGPTVTLAEPGPTVMDLATEEFDVSPASNMVDLTANTITIRKSGYYRVVLGVTVDRSFGANVGDITHYIARLYANATSILVHNPELYEVTSANDFAQAHTDKVVYLNTGDVLRIEIEGVSGYNHATDEPWGAAQLGVTFLGE